MIEVEYRVVGLSRCNSIHHSIPVRYITVYHYDTSQYTSTIHHSIPVRYITVYQYDTSQYTSTLHHSISVRYITVYQYDRYILIYTSFTKYPRRHEWPYTDNTIDSLTFLYTVIQLDQANNVNFTTGRFGYLQTYYTHLITVYMRWQPMPDRMSTLRYTFKTTVNI